MNVDQLGFFERRILSELKELEQQIKKLEAERRTLQKHLAKARAERTGLKSVTRKNSINRVLAENSVIEKLKDSNRPLSTKYLYNYARLTNYDLKASTFRTYLHRMKKRGLIKTASRVGEWELDK